MTLSEVVIDGETRLVGLMGWPVEHTRSPRMHNAAFRALGLNWVYLPLAVSPDRVEEAVRGLRALGFAGCNVTIPHKHAVASLMDSLSPVAAATHAANTVVVCSDGSLFGDNTDGDGFMDDLRSHQIEVAGRKALVIGAGGAAASVSYALAGVGADVTITNRTTKRAAELAETVARSLPSAHVRPEAYRDATAIVAPEAGLIVNATSVGLPGHLSPDAQREWWETMRFRPGQVAYDLIYTGGGERTVFLEMAEAAGARAMGGLGMLVYQGARSFELWTGQKAPVDVMFAALAG